MHGVVADVVRAAVRVVQAPLLHQGQQLGVVFRPRRQRQLDVAAVAPLALAAVAVLVLVLVLVPVALAPLAAVAVLVLVVPVVLVPMREAAPWCQTTSGCPRAWCLSGWWTPWTMVWF